MKLGTFGSIHVKELSEPGEKPKRWQARTRMRDRDGITRQVTATGSTKAKADANLREKLADRAAPAVSAGITLATRYEAIAAMWLESVKLEKAGTTYDTYRRVMRSAVLPRFGAYTIGEIDGAAAWQAIQDVRRGSTANAARQFRSVLSGPLSLATEMGVIPANPVRSLSSIQGKSKPSRALTVEEERRLLEFVDTDKRARNAHMHHIVRFMLGTGCRISEALGVRWRDVDFDEGIVRIDGAITRESGHQGMRYSDGKTLSAKRTLALPPEVVAVLRERYDQTWMHGDVPVFVSSNGTFRDLNNLQKLFRYVRAGAGLGWMTSHTFRRTVATRMDSEKFSGREVADQLGHSRPSMSQDVYMARTARGPARAADVLGPTPSSEG